VDVICEDEDHFEEVLFEDTKVVFDKWEKRPKRVCSECAGKERYRR